MDELPGDQIEGLQALLCARQHDRPLTRCDQHRGEKRRILSQ